MTADFLLELLSEEIPARMQAKARNDLARMMAEALAAAGLKHDGITTYSTPRRLVLIARGLPAATEAVAEELKGPKTAAPPQALEGFLRKTGLSHDQLQDRDGTWFAVIDKPGRPTADVLAETVAAIVRDFAWPKSMRWGEASASTASLRWVRPLHSIVALLGEAIVPVAIDGVACGASTLGHRFHHPGPITIGGAHDYVEKLRACHVLVDHAEREDIVRKGALVAAEDAGFNLVEDEGLVVENAGLTEWPVPLLGSFDADYLDVPPEVIQLTARTNQKYFVMRDGEGRLAPNFVCVANIDANDGGAAIIAGNERVLAARLSDARFFWQQDVKVPLADYVPQLANMVFHERLGTMLDRCGRIAGIAAYFADQFQIPFEIGHRTGYLCKADLVTAMVGEFPELQGIIGGYYASLSEDEDIARAIRDHYKPQGPNDSIPEDRLTVAVSLAEKLDSLVGFFLIGEQPTGSKDPFALRRATLGVVAMIIHNDIRMNFLGLGIIQVAMLHVNSTFRRLTERNPSLDPIWQAFKESGQSKINYEKYLHQFEATLKEVGYPGSFEVSVGLKRAVDELKEWSDRLPTAIVSVAQFVVDRLKVQQRETGVRHDLIDAVFSIGGEDDLVRLLGRVKALQAFVETSEGTNLLAGYKRAANILKKEGWSSAPAQAGALGRETQTSAPLRPSPEHDGVENALIEALDTAEPTSTAAIAAEDFTAAMSALASLRAPIDAFFEGVMIKDPDPTIRTRRLGLLARFRDAVHAVADFSKIEG